MNNQPFTTDILSNARRNDLYADAAAVRTNRVSVGSQPVNTLRSVAGAAARFVAVMRVTVKTPVAAGR